MVMFFIATVAAKADGVVSFDISTPLIVTADEPFRVEFILENATPDSGSFEAPSFEGMDVLAGPTVSTGSQFTIVNGVQSQKTTYTITFIAMASRAGNINIGSASVMVSGKEYKTKSTPIEVVAAQASSQESANVGGHGSSVQKQLAPDDILLRMNLSRSSVYKGEPVKASLVLYTRANVAGLNDFKITSFDGFWSQELPMNGPQASRVSLNDKAYEAYVLKEYLLYPQKTGRLTISPTTLTAIAQIVVNNNRYDPFFGRGADVYDVQRTVSTGEVAIEVKDLPSGAPASFSGAVGEFTLTSEVPAEQMTANSAGTYVVRISGSGNLNFLQTPTLSLPSSFELYDVRKTEQINTTSSGISGYKAFEYPFIVRSEGEYNIDGVLFTYFNPSSGKYITLQGKPMSLTILPDQKSAISSSQVVTLPSQEDVAQLGSDIRFIKLGVPELSRVVAPLMLSKSYFIVLAVILLMALVIYIVVSRHIKSKRNVVLVRNRRANKVAIQRFHTAAKFMKAGNRHDFFREMSLALWGYISDKLNIPVANLAKENIRYELHNRGIEEEYTREFTDIITRCDEAQYSPAESVRMEEVYAAGVNIISHIESAIKR